LPAGNLTSVQILLFFLTIWVIGLLITFVHESAHALTSLGKIEYIQIGITFGISLTIGKFTLYPLIPVGGGTKVTIQNPTREGVILFALAGMIAGLIASLLVGIIGFNLLPPETLAEVFRNRKMGFLLNGIIDGTVGIQTTIATGFIASAVMYSVQQVGNLVPIPGYDGHQILLALRSGRTMEIEKPTF
jgi:Zn-dependent protease